MLGDHHCFVFWRQCRFNSKQSKPTRGTITIGNRNTALHGKRGRTRKGWQKQMLQQGSKSKMNKIMINTKREYPVRVISHRIRVSP
jgi:hypothetical protein